MDFPPCPVYPKLHQNCDYKGIWTIISKIIPWKWQKHLQIPWTRLHRIFTGFSTHQNTNSIPLEPPKKTLLLFIKSWLFNRDPYNGLLKTQYNHLYTSKQPQGGPLPPAINGVITPINCRNWGYFTLLIRGSPCPSFPWWVTKVQPLITVISSQNCPCKSPTTCNVAFGGTWRPRPRPEWPITRRGRRHKKPVGYGYTSPPGN